MSGESEDITDEMRDGFYGGGIGDAATVVVGDNLYCIGGFKVEYDAELKLFYQSPQVLARKWGGKWEGRPSAPANNLRRSPAKSSTCGATRGRTGPVSRATSRRRPRAPRLPSSG